MRKVILSLFLLNMVIATHAKTKLDSLNGVWQDRSKSDSTRVSAYYDLIYNGFLFSKPDTAIVLSQALLKYSEQRSYAKAKAMAYNLMGNAYQTKSDFYQALTHHNLSLKIYEELGDKLGISKVLGNIGVVYKSQGNHAKALEYYHRSLTLSEEIGEKEVMASSLNNIGTIYKLENDLEKSFKFRLRSLKLSEEIGDKRGMAATLNNIGIIYKEQGNYSKSLECYQRSLKLKEEIGDKQGVSQTLGNIGLIYRYLGDIPKSNEFLRRSMKINQEIGFQLGVGTALQKIGTNYHHVGNYAKALEYYKKALTIIQEVESIVDEKNICKHFYETYKAMGNHAMALMYHEKKVALEDSIFNEENVKKMTQLEMQYDFDKKEAATKADQDKKDAIAAQELSRQKLVRNGIGGGLAFALLFLGVVWRQRNRIGREKKRSEELLLNILPEEVAEELMSNGEAVAKQFDQVTVMFTDFKGFTEISEKLTPSELVAEIHTCFKAFDKIIDKYNIEKIKTIGDSYMCASGLPVTNTTNAFDIVKAAIEIQKFIQGHILQLKKENKESFEVRIGVHTGPVVAGIVGVKKFQYDIWGDTVNTASRMESSGEVGKVNISGTTYELVKDKFTCTYRGKIQAKGKGELEMYFVEG